MAIGSEMKKMEKEILRKRLMGEREKLAAPEVRKLGAAIQKRFLSMGEYKSAGSIMFYYSVGNEAPTREAISHALESKKRVALPVIGTEGNEIAPVFVEGMKSIKKRAFGVAEPEGEPANFGEISIVVVPVVAFDWECDRLGRGLGYYDRFLKKVRALKVGFAFESQRVPNIPREEHDVRLDRIVTEAGIISGRL